MIQNNPAHMKAINVYKMMYAGLFGLIGMCLIIHSVGIILHVRCMINAIWRIIMLFLVRKSMLHVKMMKNAGNLRQTWILIFTRLWRTVLYSLRFTIVGGNNLMLIIIVWLKNGHVNRNKNVEISLAMKQSTILIAQIILFVKKF